MITGRSSFVLLTIIFLSSNIALAKGPSVALKGEIENLKLDSNGRKIELAFSGSLRWVQSARASDWIFMELSAQLKNFELKWDSVMCESKNSKTETPSLVMSGMNSRKDILDCISQYKEVYIEIPITPMFELNYRGRKIESIKGNLSLHFQPIENYPY